MAQPDPSSPDAALLKELIDRFDYAQDATLEIRKEAATDMQYVAGDPWDAGDRKLREDAGRPCLSLDELGQYFNQVINDVRANPRGMKFAPVGEGANDETARFYADKAREIEYRSRASIVYTTAFENAVQRSYGFCRVNTRYESDRSFNQDIWLEPIANPESVLIDPDAISPDSSDMKYAFVIETRTVDEFKREFPNAKIQTFSKDLATAAPRWIKGERIQIAEYWTINTKRRKLLLLKMPQGPPLDVFEDELPEGEDFPILKEREVDEKSVCQYLTNGVEILHTTEWPGKYIPIVSCYGKVLYVPEGGSVKKVILSMTRLARDPYMAYCFYRTSEIEVVGMTTKNPYWAYEGQLDPKQLTEVQKSIHEPVAVLLAKPVTDATGNQILPLPVRNSQQVELQGLSLGAEEMRRAIQAAMGVAFLPTQAQRQNEKSGKALEKMDQSAQKGSFHFVDHYNDMVQHVGVIIEDLIDKIYDGSRDVGIRKPNEEAEIVRINDPQAKTPISTKGTYQVTVSTGPSFDSEREVASEFADSLIESKLIAEVAGPQAAAKVLARAVKLKNLGPIGDEIADIIDPPQPKAGEPPTPQQLEQQLAQMKQQFQQLEQIAQEMKQAIDTDQAKQQATIKKAEMDGQAAVRKAEIDRETQITLQEMRNAATIAVAHIAAASKGLALDAHAAEERQALGHEAALGAADADHERQMAELEHEQGLEAGEVGHQQTMEQAGAQMSHEEQMAAQAAEQSEAGA